MIRKWKKFPFSWLLPVLFFAALWLLGTTGIYNDSNQYIAMHIHREPLYSFFLWIFRSLFGETKYLVTAGRIKLLPAVLYTPSSCTAP